MSFEVNGADQFLKLSKALKRAGKTEMRKELTAGIKAAAKPAVADAKDAFERELPGGAGKYFGKKRPRVAVKTGELTAGVSVVFPKTDARLESEGRLLHPVFDRRNAAGKRIMVVQKVPSNILGRRLERSTPAIRRDIEAVIERVAQRVVDEAGGR